MNYRKIFNIGLIFLFIMGMMSNASANSMRGFDFLSEGENLQNVCNTAYHKTYGGMADIMEAAMASLPSKGYWLGKGLHCPTGDAM